MLSGPYSLLLKKRSSQIPHPEAIAGNGCRFSVIFAEFYSDIEYGSKVWLIRYVQSVPGIPSRFDCKSRRFHPVSGVPFAHLSKSYSSCWSKESNRSPITVSARELVRKDLQKDKVRLTISSGDKTSKCISAMAVIFELSIQLDIFWIFWMFRSTKLSIAISSWTSPLLATRAVELPGREKKTELLNSKEIEFYFRNSMVIEFVGRILMRLNFTS